MIRYVGLDVHKREVEVCILDRAGNRLFRGRIACNRQTLEQFARKQLTSRDRVALEANMNTWTVAAILEPYVKQVVVSNPLRTKAIAEAKIKTDKVDAEVLAQLLRCNFLPSVWQPDEATRQLRRLTSHRTSLVGELRRVKTRIQTLLSHLLIEPPSLWTIGGQAWLKQGVRGWKTEQSDRPTLRHRAWHHSARALLRVANDRIASGRLLRQAAGLRGHRPP